MDRKTAAVLFSNVTSMDLMMFMWRMPTKLYGGGNVKVWGCFSCNGDGELVFIDRNMNSEVYRGILNALV